LNPRSKKKNTNRFQVDLQRKKNVKRELESYKARLVAKGYCQKQGIDNNEVFAPVAGLETIRLIITTTTQHSGRSTKWISN